MQAFQEFMKEHSDVLEVMMNNPQLLDAIQQQVNIRKTPTIIKRVKNNIDEKESQLFSFFKLIILFFV